MLKVLIVEDDFMIADCLEAILIEAGYDVCGIAGTVAEAVQLGRRFKPDLAILDLRLRDGHLGTEVAAALRQTCRCGVLYATGNPDHPLLKLEVDAGCVAKPYSPRAIIHALKGVQARMQRPRGGLPPGGGGLFAGC